MLVEVECVQECTDNCNDFGDVCVLDGKEQWLGFLEHFDKVLAPLDVLVLFCSVLEGPEFQNVLVHHEQEDVAPGVGHGLVGHVYPDIILYNHFVMQLTLLHVNRPIYLHNCIIKFVILSLLFLYSLVAYGDRILFDIFIFLALSLQEWFYFFEFEFVLNLLLLIRISFIISRCDERTVQSVPLFPLEQVLGTPVEVIALGLR